MSVKSVQYDENSPQSILEYSKLLTGRSLRYFMSNSELLEVTQNKKNKGDIGNLVEKYFFRISPGNSPEPDFPRAKVELKTTAVIPVKGLKQINIPPAYKAKERLKLNSINYGKIVEEQWETSTLLKKSELLLVIPSLYDNRVEAIDRLFINEPILWKLNGREKEIVRNDWLVIKNKIKEGRAHELSGADTLYLEACTSGSGKLVRQPFSSMKAKQRSLAFKASFVSNSILSQNSTHSESLDLGEKINSLETLKTVISNRTAIYQNERIDNIANTLNYNLSSAKHYLTLLSYKMLGIKNRNAEEFVKSGIEIKTLNFEFNGRLKEDLSFPAFSYMDIIHENWNDSVFKQKIDTQILFMVFQKQKNGEVRFVKSLFWSMPKKDISEAKKVWLETKKRISNGNADNLPLKTFSDVAHVRNHSGNSRPTTWIKTPDNSLLPIKGFWLNAKYISEVIVKTVPDLKKANI